MDKSCKRSEIVRAALELIAEQGFHGAPMAMIADRAGVGAGTIYRYFESKDILIIELHREIEDKIIAAVREGYLTDKPIKERFFHLTAALLRYFITFPLEFRYMEQFYNSPYGTAYRRDKLMGKAGEKDEFRKLWDDGVAWGEVKDLPLAILFALQFGPLLAVLRDHILGFVALDDLLVEQVVEACWDGIKRSL